MFEAHFGLRENPFSTSHDPRFVYPSPEHLEAVAHFRYGLQNREGFVLVTGEVGTGKTTAIQDLVSRLPQHAQVALIQNTALSRSELLEEICRRFNVDLEAGLTKPDLMCRLEASLRSRSERGDLCLLVVDEAQNLSRELLEEIRLLSNFELGMGNHFLICMVGQPELEDRLSQPDLRQLRQRISVKYKLQPLDELECGRYLHHRIRVAGGDGERLFPLESIRALHGVTHGIPRENNIVAGQAMLNAYVDGSPLIRPEHVQQVLEEFSFQSVLADPPAPPDRAPPAIRPIPTERSPSVRPDTAPVEPLRPRPRPVLRPAVAAEEATPSVSRVPAAVEMPVTPEPLEAASPPVPPAVPTEVPAVVGNPRNIADWKDPSPSAFRAGELGELGERVSRLGRLRIPLRLGLVAIVLASIVGLATTEIGRDLWSSLFPSADRGASGENSLEEKSSGAPTFSQEPVATTQPPAPAPTPWTIQAAAFRQPSNARRALALFEASTGLRGRLVSGGVGYENWHRVILGSFGDPATAQEKSVELLQQRLIPDDRFVLYYEGQSERR